MVTLCVCVLSLWGIWGFLCFLLFLGGGGVDFDFDTSKWCYREAGRALFRCFWFVCFFLSIFTHVSIHFSVDYLGHWDNT